MSGGRPLAPPKCGGALAATLPTPPAALALVQAHVIGRERVPFTAVAGDLERAGPAAFSVLKWSTTVLLVGIGPPPPHRQTFLGRAETRRRSRTSRPGHRRAPTAEPHRRPRTQPTETARNRPGLTRSLAGSAVRNHRQLCPPGVIEQAGALALFFGNAGGLYAVGIGIMASFVFMVTGAWLLIVGVRREEPAQATA
jgi:hypothetical protein